MNRPASLARRASSGIGVTFAFVAALASSSGCGDLKTANPVLDGGANPGADGGDPTTPGGSAGPGAHGSLPSGYCCTDDSECRNRHCAAVGTGGKMCLDHCYSDSPCTRRDLAFTCDAPNQDEGGFCQPPSPSFACIPQANFQRGTRAVGECCEATGNGNAGEECEGNLCDSKGMNDEDGPFVCTQWCDLTKDCPSGTVCNELNWCEPANFPYTCK